MTANDTAILMLSWEDEDWTEESITHTVTRNQWERALKVTDNYMPDATEQAKRAEALDILASECPDVPVNVVPDVEIVTDPAGLFTALGF